MQMISNCSCGMKNVKWFWMFSLNTLNLWNYSIFVGKFETFDLITNMIKIMCVFLFIDVQPYHHCTFLNKINFFQISKTFCQIKILSCNIVVTYIALSTYEYWYRNGWMSSIIIGMNNKPGIGIGMKVQVGVGALSMYHYTFGKSQSQWFLARATSLLWDYIIVSLLHS